MNVLKFLPTKLQPVKVKVPGNIGGGLYWGKAHSHTHTYTEISNVESIHYGFCW